MQESQFGEYILEQSSHMHKDIQCSIVSKSKYLKVIHYVHYQSYEAIKNKNVAFYIFV